LRTEKGIMVKGKTVPKEGGSGVKKFKSIIPVLGVAVLALSIALIGCSKPTEEMERAEAAIAEAKRVNAECASSEIASAERMLAEGKDAMDSYNYSKARDQFESAYSTAVRAKNKSCMAEAPEPEPMKPEPMLPTSHIVKKGECLWWIAEYDKVYDDPFQWPLIYDANREEIDATAHKHGFMKNEEDWIFPGQNFDLPREVSMDKIKNARKRAGAPAPYLPPGR